MKNTNSLGKAVTDFKNKLNRFLSSNNSSPEFQSENIKIQNLINENQEELKKRIINEYKKYSNTLEYFGSSSPIAQQLIKDKENLITAAELYLSFLELNKNKGNEETFLQKVKIETPLTKRNRYTINQDFIFLQIWFLIEHKDKNIFPIIEEINGKWELSFIPVEDKNLNIKELEIHAIIQESLNEK